MKAPILFSIVLLSAFSLSKADEPTIMIHGKKFQKSIAYEKIADRINELGKEITADYADKRPIFIGVLNGAAIFLSDLVRAVDIDCEIDFIKVSSYGNKDKSSGQVTLSLPPSLNLVDRDVILVEDVIDSGLSIAYAYGLISQLNPRSIKVAALLDKNLCQLPFAIDYLGFIVEPEFIIGFGLDFAQLGRNYKDLYRLADN